MLLLFNYKVRSVLVSFSRIYDSWCICCTDVIQRSELLNKEEQLGDIDIQLTYTTQDEKNVETKSELDVVIRMHTTIVESPRQMPSVPKHTPKPRNKVNKIGSITSSKDKPSRLPAIWIAQPKSENDTEVNNFLESALCPENWTAPWQVGLMFLTKDQREKRCGGVLVHKRWVLTAAHCLENTLGNPFVMLGSNKYLDGFLGEGQALDVAKSIIHEDYKAETKSQPPLHDIALLKLNSDAQLGDSVSVARLPKRNSSLLVPDTEMIISGWGYTEKNQADQEAMRCARVPLVSLQKCQKDYKDINFTGISKNHLCTGYSIGAAEPCKGDSGGGLVHRGSDGNTTVLGIVSWSKECGQHHHVYTNVMKHRSWLFEKAPELKVTN